LVDQGRKPAGPPQGLLPTGRVRHWLASSQAASPISSVIRAPSELPGPLAATGFGTGLAGEPGAGAAGVAAADVLEGSLQAVPAAISAAAMDRRKKEEGIGLFMPHHL
jgi:hypothetical protein